jgi:NtrC-family two-component system sensor histidine kinase KinB
MNLKPQAGETVRASLELLYHISRELTTALELRTVLKRVLHLSMEAVGATNGSIIVLDDLGKPVDSAIIIGDLIHDSTNQQLHETLDNGLAGWVARNQEAAVVADTWHDDRWTLRKYDLEENIGPRSAVSAPLLARDKLVGVMTLAHDTPAFYNQSHLALVTTIADQAGIFVLNARLYAESQRRTRAMTALAESAITITASLDLKDVLSRILEQIIHALDVQAISLAIIDAEANELVFQNAAGWMQKDFKGLRMGISQGLPGVVIKSGEGLILQNPKDDPRYDPEIESRVGVEIKTLAYAPIRYGGEVVGVLEVINAAEGQFGSDDINVLEGIGSLAGTAIHHAQLFERVQAAHQRYLQLFEDSIDPILITNFGGEILDANRRAVEATGYTEQALLSMTIDQLHQIDVNQAGENFINLTKGKTTFYDSILYRSGSGEVPVEVYIRQVQVDEEIRLQWIFRDITERKNLDTMRNDLTSMIYHDLRSPLSNVVSSLDVLISYLSTEEYHMQKSLLEIARRSTERIQRLTESLLDVNRLEAGQVLGERLPVEPNMLIDYAIEIVQPYVTNRGIHVEKLAAEDLPKIIGDVDMLRRVLTNLMENAVKFSPSQGKIQVGTRLDGGWVHFWVKDEGSGIDPSDHERIFDKFSRLNVEGAPKGLGLGLAYCRLTIQTHGGRIWVESEPGKGSCFRFILPVANEEDKSCE